MLSFCSVKLELDYDTTNAPINETAETRIIDVTMVLIPRRLLLPNREVDYKTVYCLACHCKIHKLRHILEEKLEDRDERQVVRVKAT